MYREFKVGDFVTMDADFAGRKTANESEGIIKRILPATGSYICEVEWEFSPVFIPNTNDVFTRKELNDYDKKRGQWMAPCLKYAWGCVPWQRMKKEYEKYGAKHA